MSSVSSMNSRGPADLERKEPRLAPVAGAGAGVYERYARGIPDPGHCADHTAPGYAVWRAARPCCLVRHQSVLRGKRDLIHSWPCLDIPAQLESSCRFDCVSDGCMVPLDGPLSPWLCCG